MTSQSMKSTIAIPILPSIWRSKGKQRKKYGQLIGYNMKQFFLEKSYTKCGGETVPRPFYKKLKLSIFLDRQS